MYQWRKCWAIDCQRETLKTKEMCGDSFIHPWTFVCWKNKGLKKGLKIALCGGLVPCGLRDIARMAATQREILPCSSPHHVKVELSRGEGGGLPTSREVKSARVKLETWKWLKKQPLQLEVFRADTREV